MGIRLKIQLCVRTCHGSHHHLARTSLLCGQAQPLPLFLSSVNPRNKVPGAWWAGVQGRGETVCEADKFAKAKKTCSRLGHRKEKIKKKKWKQALSNRCYEICELITESGLEASAV